MSIRTLVLPTATNASWGDFIWPSKAPVDDLDYRVDATRWLADAGLTITNVKETHTPGLTVSEPYIIAGVVALRIAGGLPETVATVRLMLALQSAPPSGDPEDLEVVVRLTIRAAAPEGLIGNQPGNGGTNTADGSQTVDTLTLTADAG